jgi:hypothetical protein
MESARKAADPVAAVHEHFDDGASQKPAAAGDQHPPLALVCRLTVVMIVFSIHINQSGQLRIET